MIELIPAIDIIDGKCVRLSQGPSILLCALYACHGPNFSSRPPFQII